jgi:hypothetical protein
MLVKDQAQRIMEMLYDGLIGRLICFYTPCQVGGYMGIHQAITNRQAMMTLQLGREMTPTEAHSLWAAMGGVSNKIEDGRGTCEKDGCGL